LQIVLWSQLCIKVPSKRNVVVAYHATTGRGMDVVCFTTESCYSFGKSISKKRELGRVAAWMQ
jgi:hypothetical protein